MGTMTIHHSSQKPEDRADQTHRDKRLWPEPWRKTVLQVVWVPPVLAAATLLFVHLVNEETPGVPVFFRVHMTVTQQEANQRKSKPRT